MTIFINIYYLWKEKRKTNEKKHKPFNQRFSSLDNILLKK